MKIEELYRLYRQHYLVDTDTRKIRKNTLYFALKGANFNGNKFAEEAIHKGAKFSIVDEKQYHTSSNTILVDDVLTTLQELANYHRKQLNVPIIGLTGSNGKTTTKELINAVLSTQYKTTATIGNLNNHIGVPLTLLSMTAKTEIGIVEMGANHHKEIELLCEISNPNYGYITNFGKAHLEGFGSIEGVIEAKSELYNYLKENKQHVFVNNKDSIQIKKTTKMNTLVFETSIQFLEANPFVKLKYDNEIISSQLIGDYNFSNLSAAITIGKYFKISTENIKNSLECYTPSNNRSQVIKTEKNNTLILDAYNANPTSMKAALKSFSNSIAENKVVVIGDMFELGSKSKIEHQHIVDYCNELNYNNVIIVGELFHQTTTNFLKFKTFEELKNYLIINIVSNSNFLIKGSRGMALERIADYL